MEAVPPRYSIRKEAPPPLRQRGAGMLKVTAQNWPCTWLGNRPRRSGTRPGHRHSYVLGPKASGQDPILHLLPPTFGARLCRIYPHTARRGQQTEYFKNQLQAFIDRRRVNFFMFRVAHSLSPEMLTALADHFKALNPSTLGGAPSELVDAGKKIFVEGLPGCECPCVPGLSRSRGQG